MEIDVLRVKRRILDSCVGWHVKRGVGIAIARASREGDGLAIQLPPPQNNVSTQRLRACSRPLMADDLKRPLCSCGRRDAHGWQGVARSPTRRERPHTSTWSAPGYIRTRDIRASLAIRRVRGNGEQRVGPRPSTTVGRGYFDSDIWGNVLKDYEAPRLGGASCLATARVTRATMLVVTRQEEPCSLLAAGHRHDG